ncbi:hypothetical protein [Natrarchaeobaculum aegyptiacum]|nr:hypothetical protein [Natrarchaeobaculum aegyptiacum]
MTDWSLVDWAGWMDEESAQRQRKRLGRLEAVDREETDAVLDRPGIDRE